MLEIALTDGRLRAGLPKEDDRPPEGGGGTPPTPFGAPTPAGNRGAPAREVDVKPPLERAEKAQKPPKWGFTRKNAVFRDFWQK